MRHKIKKKPKTLVVNSCNTSWKPIMAEGGKPLPNSLEWFTCVQPADSTGKCHALYCSCSLWTHRRSSVWGRARRPAEVGVCYSLALLQSCDWSSLAPHLAWVLEETPPWCWAFVSGPGVWVAQRWGLPWHRASWEGTWSADHRVSPSIAAADCDVPSQCPFQSRANQ